MTQTAAQRKAAERQRYKDAGLVAVQVWINPKDRIKLARYVKRLNQRAQKPSFRPSLNESPVPAVTLRMPLGSLGYPAQHRRLRSVIQAWQRAARCR